MIGRVADTIGGWAARGYFATDRKRTRSSRARAILVNQYLVQLPGLVQRRLQAQPQCSACFILDRRLHESILTGSAVKESSSAVARSGLNLSRLRSSKEQL
jgi:hypothetical protein